MSVEENFDDLGSFTIPSIYQAFWILNSYPSALLSHPPDSPDFFTCTEMTCCQNGCIYSGFSNWWEI
ncbi:MAG: hypothetical protein EA362_01225 [Saprospirales bacterium]|nr:MAG: hypothetical protein EA362_01225 [Saprospirales bacterium]